MRLNLKDPCKAPQRLVGWTQLKIPDVSQCPGAEAPSPSIVWEPLSAARASPPGGQLQPPALLSRWNTKGRSALSPGGPAAPPWNKPASEGSSASPLPGPHGPASPTPTGPSRLRVQAPPRPEAQAGPCGLPACHCSPPGFGSRLSFCCDSRQLLVTDFPTLRRFWLRRHFFLRDVCLSSSFYRKLNYG